MISSKPPRLQRLRHTKTPIPALLHGIHSVFPPPLQTGHAGDDPVHPKKIHTEGTWEPIKEVLGWIMDGVTRCISLPAAKIGKLKELLLPIKKIKAMKTKDMQSFKGKLQHATTGIPGALPLMGPFHKGTKQQNFWTTINKSMVQSSIDFTYIMNHIAAQPSKARNLVPNMPSFVGPHDASKLGAGGVWYGGTKRLPPTVWRVEWPKEVKDSLISEHNLKGQITNSDLELAGQILQMLVLEGMIDLEDQHTLTSCDNTPTVAWVSKLCCSKSQVATNLLKIWGSRMLHAKIPKPMIHYIEGHANKLADYASRKFNTKLQDETQKPISDYEFLTLFNSKFPLPQNQSWRLFHLNGAVVSRIIAVLLTKPSSVASWRRVTTKGNASGIIGSPNANSITWTHGSPTKPQPNKSPPWKFLQTKLEKANFPMALASECKRLKSHLELSA